MKTFQRMSKTVVKKMLAVALNGEHFYIDKTDQQSSILDDTSMKNITERKGFYPIVVAFIDGAVHVALPYEKIADSMKIN